MPRDVLEAAHRRAIGRVTEWEGRRRNGDVFPFELALFEFTTPEGRRFAGNVRDISDRRATERMTNEFVSVVSHELRTPPTSIKGSLQLLLGEDGQTEVQPQLLAVALSNTDRLIRIVNDMLDIAKIEAGRTHARPPPVRGR